MTIEAVEQGKSGAYEINLRCNLDDGAIVLDSFCLKGPKPLGTREGAFISLESIYETVKDNGSDPSRIDSLLPHNTNKSSMCTLISSEGISMK
nr:hypothetical protein [Tanacetum cinerariifolium]